MPHANRPSSLQKSVQGRPSCSTGTGAAFTYARYASSSLRRKPSARISNARISPRKICRSRTSGITKQRSISGSPGNLSNRGTILDFGSGRGCLSEALKAMGFDVSSFEPMIHGRFDRQAYPRQFNLVIANQVIEHMTDIVSEIGNILPVLEPGGLLFFQQPVHRSLHLRPRFAGVLQELVVQGRSDARILLLFF